MGKGKKNVLVFLFFFIYFYYSQVVFPDVNGRDGAKAPTSANDLKVKYEEIVKYTQRLTEQKELVTKEITTLKKQLDSGSGGKSGYQLWHIVLCVIVSIFAMRLFEKYKEEIVGATGLKF